jgi:hypothetical protein
MHKKNLNKKILKTYSLGLKADVGFSTLPAVLFIGGLIVEISVAVAFLLTLFSNTSYSARLSSQAFAVAETGIEDGIIKVVRNKDCPGLGCPSSYDLAVGSFTASVTICNTCEGAGETRVDSIGSAGSKKRKIRAILSVNATSGKVDINSIGEISL